MRNAGFVGLVDRIVADSTGRIAAASFPEQGRPVRHAAAVSITTG